ncbi:MAG: hypothetical protein GX639_09130 [Fibrobacter sp.]|nr:hypothetical protein [Fibrobacter sp.]
MDMYVTWLEKGDKYLASVKDTGKSEKFSPVIQYNLIAMAFESYAMAILDYHKQLPDNHTITDLLDALDKVIHIDTSLRNAIIRHENTQMLCPVFEYSRSEPTIEEIMDFRGKIVTIAAIAKKIISQEFVDT